MRRNHRVAPLHWVLYNTIHSACVCYKEIETDGSVNHLAVPIDQICTLFYSRQAYTQARVESHQKCLRWMIQTSLASICTLFPTTQQWKWTYYLIHVSTLWTDAVRCTLYSRNFIIRHYIMEFPAYIIYIVCHPCGRVIRTQKLTNTEWQEMEEPRFNRQQSYRAYWTDIDNSSVYNYMLFL